MNLGPSFLEASTPRGAAVRLSAILSERLICRLKTKHFLALFGKKVISGPEKDPPQNCSRATGPLVVRKSAPTNPVSRPLAVSILWHDVES